MLDVLWSREPTAPARSPIEEPYGSSIEFPDTRPYVFANFVETLDGVTGDRDGWDANEISIDSAIDRHVMALLRALADAIVIGAGTFRAARDHQWSPGGLVPGADEAFDDLREATRGRRERAHLYVVTASGSIDPAHVALTRPEAPVTIVTTREGAVELRDDLPGEVELVTLEARAWIDPAVLLQLVTARSGGLILCEGGPTAFGRLCEAGLVDELFVTVSPQLAGRDDRHRRQGLVEGFAASPDNAPRLGLHSIRRARDHLFLRYTTDRAI